MKKKHWKALLAAGMLVCLAGCAKNTEDGAAAETAVSETDIQEETQTEETQSEEAQAEEAAAVYVSQYDVSGIELGEYKGLVVDVHKDEITEETVDAYLENVRQQLLEPVTGRDVVESGDTVNIDYEGKKDGVAFDGGTAQGYDLEIGSGAFIDGFEEGLVGVKKGETVDLELAFPEGYSAEELAGADVVFTVTVNEIQTHPQLDDEFAAALGIEGVATLEEYRAYVEGYLIEQAEQEYQWNVQAAALAQITENSAMEEPAQELQQKYADQINEQMSSYASYYGMTVEDYVSALYGITLDEYALETAKQALVLQKIAQLEGMEVTDGEIDENIESNEYWGYADAEEFKAVTDMTDYRDSLLQNKVFAFLFENTAVEHDHSSD